MPACVWSPPCTQLLKSEREKERDCRVLKAQDPFLYCNKETPFLIYWHQSQHYKIGIWPVHASENLVTSFLPWSDQRSFKQQLYNSWISTAMICITWSLETISSSSGWAWPQTTADAYYSNSCRPHQGKTTQQSNSIIRLLWTRTKKNSPDCFVVERCLLLWGAFKKGAHAQPRSHIVTRLTAVNVCCRRTVSRDVSNAKPTRGWEWMQVLECSPLGPGDPAGDPGLRGPQCADETRWVCACGRACACAWGCAWA